MAEGIICVILVLLVSWKSREFLKLGVRGLCTVAILVSLASCGRALFVSIPSVQPASFIVILCGAVFGGGAGLFCGILVAVVSSLLMGFGPWTIWQALMWGLMGLLAPIPMKKALWVQVVYGFVWGFVFGWIMNMWWLFAGIIPLTWASVIAGCVSSFTFDLAHAATNAGLILALSGWVVKTLKKLAPVKAMEKRAEATAEKTEI